MTTASHPTRLLLAAAFTLLTALPAARAMTNLEIFADGGDGFIETRATGGPWPAVHPSFDGSGGEGFFMNTGEWFGDGLTSAVMPFQLPDLGAVVDPFTSAQLGVHLFEKGTDTVTDLDLYAIRTAATPDLLATDYYSGSAFDATPGVTLIQESFLTPADEIAFPAEPNIFTDSTGDANLLAYLNSSYNGGAGAGDYVFLRLSYGADGFATAWDAYKITSRNAGGGEGDYPVLSLVSSTQLGDVNNDGTVDLTDFGFISDNWLETNESFGMTLARADGDLNADGLVGIEDFREWKNAFANVGGSQAQIAQAFASLGVPEPATLVTGLVALVGLAARRRPAA